LLWRPERIINEGVTPL
jgi:hypothetical protein